MNAVVLSKFTIRSDYYWIPPELLWYSARAKSERSLESSASEKSEKLTTMVSAIENWLQVIPLYQEHNNCFKVTLDSAHDSFIFRYVFRDCHVVCCFDLNCSVLWWRIKHGQLPFLKSTTLTEHIHNITLKRFDIELVLSIKYDVSFAFSAFSRE